MKYQILYTLLALLASLEVLPAQPPLIIEGNGRFLGTASTNLDIFASDMDANSLFRFGDNGSTKVSLGYNGNQDYFNIATAGTLGVDDLTLTDNGRIGINTAPGAHRLLINHNSTSGTSGSAQLMLQENNLNDFARLRFTNAGDNAYWSIRARATNGNYGMNFFYTDNFSEATLITLDGNEEFVGIHTESPEAYLHIKQQFAGVDALALQNDNNTNKWSFRIGDEDILIYFNGGIRGGFDVSTGNYNNFPPSAALANPSKMKEEVLQQVMQLKAYTVSDLKNDAHSVGFNPTQVQEVNPEWVVPTEDGSQIGLDYLQFSVLAIKTIQEQQEMIRSQQERIAALKQRKAARMERVDEIARRVNALGSK